MSQYLFYMNKVLLPITPSSLSIQTPNRNETIDLINGAQINILKEPGLKEIQFEMVIPQVEYPFATYQRGLKFRKAELYIKEFEKLKASKKPFQFIVSRYVPIYDVKKGNVNQSCNTNTRVSLEEFNQVEDAAADGLDFRFNVSLKEYVDYGTKEFIIPKDPVAVEPVEPDRPVEPILVVLEPARKTYTVQSGDSLWGICARELGNGGKCWDVARKNSIADPSNIQPGQVIDLTGF